MISAPCLSGLAWASLVTLVCGAALAQTPPPRPLPEADGWRASGADAIRGVTVGPIENGYHPGVGYGTPAYGRTLDECAAMGATWVAITPFGRVA